jgi:hypothetical protein
MNKILISFVLVVLSGCANYKYELAQKGYDGGYLVRRHGLLIPEYTIDAQNKAPRDKKIAEERLIRRRDTVNFYYKKMGRIYNDGLTRATDAGNILTGPFKLPGAAAEDYKYEHDEEYRKKFDQEQRSIEEQELESRQSFKQELSEYIKRDMELESDAKLGWKDQ